MIEHPGTEDEQDEPHTRSSAVGGDGSDSSCPGAAAGGKSLDRSSYLCSPGDIASADASEMEEGFSERYSREKDAEQHYDLPRNTNTGTDLKVYLFLR